MKELADHILDLAQNSVAAGARHIAITLTEDDRRWLTAVVEDDGRGMTPELLAAATDPFTTTRTTRPVGMGLPLFRMTAEQTGGTLSVRSTAGQGTVVTALLDTAHMDCPPPGDLAEVTALLVQGNPELDVAYRHVTPRGRAELFTEEIRAVLGPDIPLSEPAVFNWILSTLQEQEAQIMEERSL